MFFPALGAAISFAGAPLDIRQVSLETPVVHAVPLANDNADKAHTPLRDSAGWRSEDEQTEAIVSTESTLAERDTKLPEPELDETEIVIVARERNVPGDPMQEVNIAAFKATQAVDRAVVRPAALAYSRIVPDPIRDGIRNFLDHLTEPVVFVNFLLQHKIGKAFETLGRFAVNSTIGVVGLFDIARRKPFKLPHRPNGFAYTLGFYGVKSGPFLFLPIVGPTTARDLFGIILDRSLVPLAVGKPLNRPYFTIPAAVLGQLDQRDQLDEKIQALRNDTSGAYTATREDYLERRQAEIDHLRGRRPAVNGPVPEIAGPKSK